MRAGELDSMLTGDVEGSVEGQASAEVDSHGAGRVIDVIRPVY